MKKKVTLKTIIDALEWVDDETSVYYDVQSGETIMWNDNWDNEDLDPDEVEEGLDEGKYTSLPDRFEINEYHMMEAFAYDSGDVRLINAIKGRGAFRRFKEIAEDIGVIKDWYEFRDNCYRSRAEDWCRDHNLEWEES